MIKMKQYILVICLVLALMFTLTACGDTLDMVQEDTSRSDETMPMPGISHLPLEFHSLDELVQAKKEANPENDPHGLSTLNYYYMPAYAEKWCELNNVTINYIGGNNYEQGTITLVYSLKETKNRDFMLQIFDRGWDGEILFPGIIEQSKLKPFEGVEGVYYKDVYNPGDKGELSFTEFAWVYDGYCFMMEVYPKVMNQIKKDNPEALKGPLFELKKVELK